MRLPRSLPQAGDWLLRAESRQLRVIRRSVFRATAIHDDIDGILGPVLIDLNPTSHAVADAICMTLGCSRPRFS